MSSSTTGLRPIGNGRWSAIVGSFVVRYVKHSAGSFGVEISAREDVQPRPDLVRATLAPQPTLELARLAALQFVRAHALIGIDDAIAAAERG